LVPPAALLIIVLLQGSLSRRKGIWLFESSIEDPDEITYLTGGRNVDSQSKVDLPSPSRERLVLSSM
jgi:hypothetical protein